VQYLHELAVPIRKIRPWQACHRPPFANNEQTPPTNAKSTKYTCRDSVTSPNCVFVSNQRHPACATVLLHQMRRFWQILCSMRMSDQHWVHLFVRPEKITNKPYTASAPSRDRESDTYTYLPKSHEITATDTVTDSHSRFVELCEFFPRLLTLDPGYGAKWAQITCTLRFSRTGTSASEPMRSRIKKSSQLKRSHRSGQQGPQTKWGKISVHHVAANP
jgi:hypothetical protein